MMQLGPLPVVVGVVAYVALVLQAEAFWLVLGLLALGLAGLTVAVGSGWLDRAAAGTSRTATGELAAIALGVLALVAACHGDHYALLVLAGMLTLSLATVGLSLQTQATGVPNFAGAALMGVGAYAAALATTVSGWPHLLALPVAGLIAAMAALVLLAPLRRAHPLHGAVLTLAATLLFERAVGALAVTGGGDGLKLPPLSLLGWRASFGFTLGPFEVSQYAVHVLLALAALAIVLGLARSRAGGRLGRLALGGLALGLAGALNGMLLGFVGPQFFGVTESLVLAGIAAIGGGRWGVVLAAATLALVLGKLQLLQELRVALVAVAVLAMLWLRPGGLLPAAPEETGKA